ncbi:hypothetical protein B9Z55_008431 [Caenorhabditis nigoni]|uniref:Uncharacterized protein n=1 Tax=Caenorhabditis nigoni TaxID=1611254 RepID=A0A2G5UMR9_9PELO|nr:hypothetical protein B9Z55_008431 [Caenorhabditis nigoni]
MVQSNRRLSAARQAEEKVQGAKNEKSSGASSRSRRGPADTKGHVTSIPQHLDRRCFVDEPPALQAPDLEDMAFQVQANRRLSAARKAKEKVQGAKNEKSSGASSPSRCDPADTEGPSSSIPKGLDRHWSVDEPPALQAPVSEGDGSKTGSNRRKPEEIKGPGEEEEKEDKGIWMWMERRE